MITDEDKRKMSEALNSMGTNADLTGEFDKTQTQSKRSKYLEESESSDSIAIVMMLVFGVLLFVFFSWLGTPIMGFIMLLILLPGIFQVVKQGKARAKLDTAEEMEAFDETVAAQNRRNRKARVAAKLGGSLAAGYVAGKKTKL